MKQEIIKREIPLEMVRNIGFSAHIDAGKTTTTERILYYTGKINKIGEVDEGTTTMDWMEQEQERGITITLAAITCFWKNFCINIIDTPGHVDFTAEVERAFRILDGVVVIFCGVGGVEPQSETVWHQADKYNIPRMIYVNKIDRMGADFYEVLKSIQKKLNKNALAVQIPIGNESNFKGVVDLIKMKSLIWIDDKGLNYKEEEISQDLIEIAYYHRDILLEKIVENNDILMEKYLEKKPIDEKEIKAEIRRMTLFYKIIPVFCGSSLQNKGVQPLIDGVVDYLPSPLDKPFVVGELFNGEKEERKPDDANSFSAVVFKVITDPYMGKLSFFRIYSGTLKVGSIVYNATQRCKERIGKILRMHANKKEEIKIGFTGDILSTVGLEKTTTGDTLCDLNIPIVLDVIHFPEPVISVAIEPKTKSDEKKIDESLLKLANEDPTFKVQFNEETSQCIISGMGELHLEILIDRLKREFKIGVNIGKPEVSYRETIQKEAVADGVFMKQIGDKTHFAQVSLKIIPAARGEGFKFVNKSKKGVIPSEYLIDIEEGIKEGMNIGIIASYPLIDIIAVLVDGVYRKEDASNLSFKMASLMAFHEALKKANPILMEPIMKIEINIPQEFIGECLGDFNSRRGKIDSLEAKNNFQIIKGTVPLKEIFSYATPLRSITQGRGSYNMEYFCYERIPQNLANEIISKQGGYNFFNKKLAN
ncbi:MAG: elongation factor G [bacterium]